MRFTKKQWLKINYVIRQRGIDPSQVKHINCIRFHPDPRMESDEHVKKKMDECLKLRKIGHPFITEVWTRDKKQRFDIIDLEDDIDIEIERSKSKKAYKGDKEVKV